MLAPYWSRFKAIRQRGEAQSGVHICDILVIVVQISERYAYCRLVVVVLVLVVVCILCIRKSTFSIDSTYCLYYYSSSICISY